MAALISEWWLKVGLQSCLAWNSSLCMPEGPEQWHGHTANPHQACREDEMENTRKVIGTVIEWIKGSVNVRCSDLPPSHLHGGRVVTESRKWGGTTTMTLQASTMFYSRLQPRLSTGLGTQLARNTCLLSHDWIKDVTERGAAAGSVSHHDFARTCCVTRGESPPPGPSSHP